jgi:WD40 repeat protein
LSVLLLLSAFLAYAAVQNIRLEEQRNTALTSQSRFLADLSGQQLAAGDRATALLLAFAALPEDLNRPERPLVPEAEASLRNAVYRSAAWGWSPAFTLQVGDYAQFVRVGESRLHVLTGAGEAGVWDLRNGTLVLRKSIDEKKSFHDRPLQVDWTSDDPLLVYEDRFELVDPESGERRSFDYATFDANGHYRFSGAYLGKFLFYSISGGLELRDAQGRVLFSDDTKNSYAVMSKDTIATVHDAHPLTGEDGDGAENGAYGNATYIALRDADGKNLRVLPPFQYADDAGRIHESNIWERDVVFSQDGRTFAVIGSGGAVSLWDTATGTLIAELNVPGGVKRASPNGETTCAFSEDSSLLAALAEDGAVHIYDLHGNPVRVLTDGGARLTGFTWAGSAGLSDTVQPGEAYYLLCTASGGGATAVLFDAAGGEVIFRFEDAEDASRAIFGRHGEIILIQSAQIQVWTRAEASAVNNRALRTETFIWDAAWSPDGRDAAVMTSSGYCLFDAESGEFLREMPNTEKDSGDLPQDMSRSPDGRRLVTCAPNTDGVTVWEADTGKPLLRLRLPNDGEDSGGAYTDGDNNKEGLLSAGEARFSPDGLLIAAKLTRRQSAAVFDAETGDFLSKIMPEGGSEPSAYNVLSVMEWSPDARKIMIARNTDAMIEIHDARTGALLSALNAHASGVCFAAFSQDGEKIASQGGDGTLRLWDAASGELSAELPGLEVNSSGMLAFAPDGSRVAVSGRREVVVWNPGSGETISFPVSAGYSPATNAVVFDWSPDGACLSVGNKIYDAATGAEFLTLPGVDRHLYPASFSPDGTKILCYTDSRIVSLWDMPASFGDTVEAARALIAGRRLTAAERRRFFLD